MNKLPQPFHFKQFHLHHHLCAHKVGTDGVLLGAWAEHANPAKILDVGSGSGLIGFMLAQRYPQAVFVGIEQHKASIQQARQSLAEGPFTNRGKFIHADFLEWETEEKFDLIVSNPPFFAEGQSTQKLDRDAARRQMTLAHSPMFEKMAQHLNSQGQIALILPTEEAQLLTQDVIAQGWHLHRITEVRSFPDSNTIRHLLLLSREIATTQKSVIIIRNKDGSWHSTYRELTRDFYL